MYINSCMHTSHDMAENLVFTAEEGMTMQCSLCVE